jgi:hypothetical protein
VLLSSEVATFLERCAYQIVYVCWLKFDEFKTLSSKLVTRVQIYVCGDVQDLLCAVLHVCYPPGFPGLLLLSWLLLRAALGACLPHACMFCCQACVLAVGFVCGCLVLVLVAVMMLMHHFITWYFINYYVYTCRIDISKKFCIMCPCIRIIVSVLAYQCFVENQPC